ncbi:hypothetical protein C8J57DRAFT_1520336 [Mycena rebaudengoi]|nr:hypothetical protein C8J57DRAFT_1520336 [Mycena rebaudengoi]
MPRGVNVAYSLQQWGLRQLDIYHDDDPAAHTPAWPSSHQELTGSTGKPHPDFQDFDGNCRTPALSICERRSWPTDTVLEAVQKMRKNRDDFEDLCESFVNTVSILEKIIPHGANATNSLKRLCEDLRSLLQEIELKVGQIQKNQKSRVRGILKEFIKSTSIGDELTRYKTRVEQLRSDFMLMSMAQLNSAAQLNANEEIGFPKAHKAVIKDEAGTARELTSTVVGMLQDMDLPPVRRGRVTSRNIPFVRQQASIVGLGTDQFTKALENILQVAIEVELAFDSNDVTSWTPAPISDELGDSIQASARYFTLAKDAPAKQVVEFNSHVDPLSLKNPSGFREGDIVEMGFNVVVFKPQRDAKAVVKLVMKSLIFLDGTQTRDARVRQRIAEVKAERYLMDEVAITAKKAKRRLGIDDSNTGDEENRRPGPIIFGQTGDEFDSELDV